MWTEPKILCTRMGILFSVFEKIRAYTWHLRIVFARPHKQAKWKYGTAPFKGHALYDA